MQIKTLARLSPGPFSRSVRLPGVPPDHAETAARGCARVDSEWATLTVRCLFQEPPFTEASGAECLFACRNGTNGTLRHRTVAVDFVHGRVDFDFLLDAEALTGREASPATPALLPDKNQPPLLICMKNDIPLTHPLLRADAAAEPDAWRVPRNAIHLDNLIEEGRSHVHAEKLRRLASESSRLLGKLRLADPDDYPDLAAAVRLAVRVLRSPETEQATDPLPGWLAEVGFAAEYLMQNEDFIPDQIPHVGLVDDHAILERVFERNRYDVRPFGASL